MSSDAGDVWWSSLVVPGVGSFAVCSAAYILGRNEFSLAWLLLLVAFNIAKSYLWKKRETRLLSLRAARMREREVITAQLADLPAWVQFPDTERVEWLNKVIQQLWPYIGEYTKVFMTDVIVPQVKTQMPAPLKSFKFTKMDIGDIGCRVGGIKVYTHNVGRDRIIVDMDIAYAGDADFTISCCGFTGGMNQIQFSGKLRCVLKPLLPYPPMVGGVSGTFLEMPKIDFNLTGMGELVELPGLMTAIRTVVNEQVKAMCVVPNEIVVPLAPNVDVTQLFFPEPNGVIRLKIVEARNLENRDISFIRKGKSDPYCEIQVGSQFFKTRTIDDDLNPVWNATFEAVVDQADGQHLRIECFDEDQGQDEELGRLTVPLSLIRDRGSIDKWYPLEGCKHGELHITASWLSLSAEAVDVEREEWQAEWMQAEKPVHPALLMIFIDNVSDLPYPKAKLEPSPFVSVSLGKQRQQTAVRAKTVNPLFQNRFHFFVKHAAGQQLDIEAMDDGTKRCLGSLSLPLTSLLKQPRLEMYQHTLMLSLGVHQSPLVATIRLRGLIHQPHAQVLPQDVEVDTLAHYATGSYIERANGVHQENGKQSEHTSTSSNVEAIQRSGSVQSIPSSSRSTLSRLLRGKKGVNNERSETRGDLEISIRYVIESSRLKLRLVRARQLHPLEGGACYCSVHLVGGHVLEKRKTAAIRSCEPIFENEFEFSLERGDLHNYKLEIRVKDDSRGYVMSRRSCLGMVTIRLADLTDCTLPLQWKHLQPDIK